MKSNPKNIEKLSKEGAVVETEELNVIEENEKKNSVEISVNDISKVNKLGCTCTRENVNLEETSGVGQLLNDMLQGRRYCNAKIKIEIDLSG